ncbi:integrase [Pseudomonas sp. N-137]|uniref:integrase n=1 Tax=Pseudomonas sp. N-137 TaxID=3108452 RepID=UPI002ADED829|nr:integrase [Pseudomonas sp. N-137]MEA1031589.1 integrase [Pseudomonas sp. N-137]
MKKKSASSASSGSAPIKPEYFSTDVALGMDFSRLSESTVISRTEQGEILSILSHDTWHLPAFAYSVSDNPKFDFLPFYRSRESRSEDLNVVKKILLMKMFGKSHSDQPLRLATVHSHRYAMLIATKFCRDKNISFKDLLVRPEIFENLIEIMPRNSKRNIISILRTLLSIKESERGFPIDGSLLHIAKNKAGKKRKSQQHPIIPSRILLLKYSQYTAVLDEFLENKDNIKSILDAGAADYNYGKSSSLYTPRKLHTHQPAASSGETAGNTPFATAIKEHGLQYLCTKHDWNSFANLLSYVSTASHCAKNLVHLFTLMRDHEVRSLTTECLEKANGWNNEALYILGISTKLHKRPKPSKWITTKAILKPITTLKFINTIFSPYSKNRSQNLFLSPALHPRSTGKNSVDELMKNTSAEERLNPVIITERDILELESIDPLRNWRDDPKFQVGKPWVITTHQFRRTMSVFAAQSGLITLTSLKRLLGHLTIVMSRYYTQGCSAKNYYFALINPELANEMQRAKQEADGAMFVRMALKSSERLYGQRGREIMATEDSDVWIMSSREETERKSALGLQAWADSPLGGCGSPYPCDKRAHGNFFTCPGCRWLIGIESIMEDTIAVMEFDLAELKPGSIEHRAEQQNLEDFRDLRDQIIAKG